MPSFCVVQNCDDKYGHGENISFHKFPFKRQELMQKWLEFAQRGPDWQPSRWSAICSRHFRDEDFTCSTDRKILRKTAVPCLHGIKSVQQLENKHVQEQQGEDRSFKGKNCEETSSKSATEDKASRVELREDNCDGYETEEENQTCSGAQLHNSPCAPKIKCRLCGTVCSSVVSFSTNFEIYGMIQKCFPTLNIQKDDHLPKEMCRLCLKRLENFSRFIDKVLETQSELQRKYRLEKANTNMRATERQLKVKQEPIVRVKQEVSEGFERLLSDDLDMAVDESCEQEPDVETNVEQKYDFCDFPMLNAQDIINNCDIMEIINLDDPFIDIPDDDANTICENGTTQTQQQEQQRVERRIHKPAALPSAHELLQAHLLSEEHNYAYAATDDMKEEWQLKNTYKTEKTESGEQLGTDANEFITNAENEEEEHVVYASEHEHQVDDSADQRVEDYTNAELITTTTMDANKLPPTSAASISASNETRSARPIVTSVSELADATHAIPSSKAATEHNLSTSTTRATAASTESTTTSPAIATMKPHAKPNIVVLNESIVKSSSVFQIHTCHYCHLKFFSGESLNQHYLVAHQMQPQLGQEQQQMVQTDQLQQQQHHQQRQQLQPHNLYNEEQHNIMTPNQSYQQQQQQHHQHQEQLPMVSVPAEYLWKPYGMPSGNGDGVALNHNCKIEKGYGSPNTCNDFAYKGNEDSSAYQQTHLFDQPFEFENGNSTRETQVLQNCQNPKDATGMGAPNAVRILEMKRTFLRHHEPYANGVVNAPCEYSKIPINGNDNSYKSTNFCALNVAHMDDNQMRFVAPIQPISMPNSIEGKRTKRRMLVNKKIIARLKALERKLSSTAAPNLISAEYRQLRRLYTMLQLKCKRLELQINEKHHVTHKSAPSKTAHPKQKQQQQLKAKLKKRFSCRLCPHIKFKSIYHLLHHKHKRAHWGRRIPKQLSATCGGCEKFFRHKIALHNHMRYICQALPLCWFKTQMKTFKCRYCRRSTFNHWRLYRRHEVKCKTRQQRLKNKASEQRRVKTKQNAGKTNVRALVFKSVGDASKTTSAVPTALPQFAHKPSACSMRVYACAICTKMFPSANSLNQHRITHTDQRRHKCHLCARAFKRRNGLTQHVRGYHLQLKPHQCAFCQRSYALKGDMLRCRHAIITAKKAQTAV
ncbi:uncharacterized protein [Eurosta solidaginis]|uniref:uncharacterized protein isoform X2 n=1 Tax=Eurosta solidaginis TaxID=178769 RepID=UPI003531092C